jgi:hypothetical protein
MATMKAEDNAGNAVRPPIDSDPEPPTTGEALYRLGVVPEQHEK